MEAYHALKRVVNFNRQGEIRDGWPDGQQHECWPQLLTAIIHSNAWKPGEVTEQIDGGEQTDLWLLPHVSLLGRGAYYPYRKTPMAAVKVVYRPLRQTRPLWTSKARLRRYTVYQKQYNG
ncbi:hypothetical protein BN77_4324 [Rhizobium mesoamericanum STM3625]|uniref:Uncharacterized protein n=1 Tax=Rhizobium mesoamericanum STM3625 TaxID=1211777 RepID=K0PZL1_9HYPH|nr:hypothetical protein BN77_4324 [Rhizobium mesoamericanum STM3625]